MKNTFILYECSWIFCLGICMWCIAKSMAEAACNRFHPLKQMSWKTHSMISAAPFIQVCRSLGFHQSFRIALAKFPSPFFFFQHISFDLQWEYTEVLILLRAEKIVSHIKMVCSSEEIILLPWAIESYLNLYFI